MQLADLQNKTVFILGLGKTGTAAYGFLKQQGAHLLAWDDSADKVKASGVPRDILSDVEAQNWADVDFLLKSPGISEEEPFVQAAIEAGVRLISDIDLLYLQNKDAMFIGISGTNGKSTTTALIGHLLKEAGHTVAVGGNIGTAALELPKLGKGGIYVLELSSYQLLQTTYLRCNVGVLLNLTPDHMERHKTMDGYFAAKLHLFDRMTDTDVRVLGVDTPTFRNWVVHNMKGGPIRQTSAYGTPADMYVDVDGILRDGTEGGARPAVIMDLKTLPYLPGRHNWQNIASAWAAVKNFMTIEQFQKGMASFTGLDHRLQLVAGKGNIHFVNDSKATNADATIPALGSFQTIYWIAGGRQKEGGITPCLPHLKNVKEAFLIGECAAEFAQTLEGHVPAHICGTIDKAVQQAFESAQQADHAGDVHVVLSPACASWDQFPSFEARGEAFKKAALALTEKAA